MKCSFFQVSPSSDKRIIGVKYPQVTKMSKGLAAWSDEVIKKQCHIPIDESDNILYLDDGAILTDVLSSPKINMEHGMIVNKRVRRILENVNISDSYFYPVKISFQNCIFNDYFIFHLTSNLKGISIIKNFINFKHSQFYIGIPYGEEISKVKVNEFNDLEKIKRDNFQKVISTDWNYYLCAKSFEIKKELQNLDLFNISYLDSMIYISKKLKKILEQEKISGIKISQQFTSRLTCDNLD